MPTLTSKSGVADILNRLKHRPFAVRVEKFEPAPSPIEEMVEWTDRGGDDETFSAITKIVETHPDARWAYDKARNQIGFNEARYAVMFRLMME